MATAVTTTTTTTTNTNTNINTNTNNNTTITTSTEFDIALMKSATRYKQKTEIVLVTRPPTCCKPGSCFWFGRKNKKRMKANL